MDRTKSMVIRNKNRPCIIIWSMGNESGYGCTFEEALKWTKSYDPSRLTHYESAYYRGRKRKYDYSDIDIYSRMYPQFCEVLDYVNNDPDKPFLMCEYCHAMGNGPGDLEDYYELISEYDSICGGFVWEWCDHALYKGMADNGKTIYLYGGDSGEDLHDGNFCMDGLVYPDRTPHTGLAECRNVHRPARAVSYDRERGLLTIRNELNFRNLEDAVHILWELVCDGHTIGKGSLRMPSGTKISPHESADLPLTLAIPEHGRCFLRVIYTAKNDSELIGQGMQLGFDELSFKNKDDRNQAVLARRKQIDAEEEGRHLISTREQGRHLVVSGPWFCYVFDRLTGLFERLFYDGREFLDRPMELTVWRAPTDNDIRIKEEWYKAFYDKARARAYQTEYELTEKGLLIRSRMSMCAPSVQRIMEMDTVWTVGQTGSITVRMHVVRNMEFPELPRFGLRLFLPGAMNHAVYCGLGPTESYPDKRRAAYHGIFRASVEDLHEDYLRPQENGSHDDCDYVILSDERNRFTVFPEQPFSFNASPFTQEELTRKAHNYELEPCGSTVLHLDYKQNGIGSNSCGPRPKERYRFDEEQFVYAVTMIPSARDGSDAMEAPGSC